MPLLATLEAAFRAARETDGVVNERMPWQLTVRDLRSALVSAQDDQVVTFALTPEDVERLQGAAVDGLTVIYNIAIRGGSGPIFGLEPARPSER